MDDIRRILDDLESLPSVSAFVQSYRALVAGRLRAHAPADPMLAQAFAAHLQRELQYHRRLRNIACEAGVNGSGAVPLADERAAALSEAVELVEATVPVSTAHEATRRLILAECCYGLYHYDRVVAHLEVATRLGASEPLILFALGYSRYLVARQGASVTDEAGTRAATHTPALFRTALLDAVSAFEAGLRGGPLDPHLYWWMGTCLEQAGFEAAARDAFARSEEFAVATAGASEPVPDPLAEALTDLVTAELSEPEQVADLLKRSYSVDEVRGGPEHTT